jgi:hypothetical protein
MTTTEFDYNNDVCFVHSYDPNIKREFSKAFEPILKGNVSVKRLENNKLRALKHNEKQNLYSDLWNLISNSY